jgi:hypothetical protein
MLVFEEPAVTRNASGHKASHGEVVIDDIGGVEGLVNVCEKAATAQRREEFQDDWRDIGLSSQQAIAGRLEV